MNPAASTQRPRGETSARKLARATSARMAGDAGARVLDARPDTLDFRDRMFEPTLDEVPTELSLESYRAAGVPILDQGTEGACTGFGLATVAHYLLLRRKIVPDPTPVGPWMLYAAGLPEQRPVFERTAVGGAERRSQLDRATRPAAAS